MSLHQLTDSELIASTTRALTALRSAEIQILHHFREIEQRRLWTGAGSIYKYLARTFQLTDDQIYPRLQAMRLLRVVPELEQQLEQGLLSLTVALKAQRAFAAETKLRPVALSEKREVLSGLENLSTREAEKLLAQRYPMASAPAEKVKPVAENRNLIQFYVDDQTLADIEELKARFSHQMPAGKMEDLLKILIQVARRKANPNAKQSRARDESVSQQKSREQKPIEQALLIQGKVRSRYLTAQVRREMEKSRHIGCVHSDPGAEQICGSKFFLQLDHIQEFSQGGANEVHNLRWLCGFHNRQRSGVDAWSGARSGAPG
jgi:hypothetical protein